MGLFGSLISVASAVTKVALTPIAIVTDVAAKVVVGENTEITESLFKSAGRDIADSVDTLMD